MCGISGDLVPEPLGSDDSDLVTDPLVGLEVERELGVVTLDDDLGGLLDGLCADATHFGGEVKVCVGGRGEAVGLVGGRCRRRAFGVAKMDNRISKRVWAALAPTNPNPPDKQATEQA
jgi:hypothetical protein